MGRLVAALCAATAIVALAVAPAAAAPLTSRVSFDLDGSQRTDWSQHAAVSADGRFVAYEVQRGDYIDGYRNEIYLYDRATGKTEWISAGPNDTPGDGSSEWPAVSRDGRYVAFRSSSNDLVPDDPGHGVFVRDRRTGSLERMKDPRTDEKMTYSDDRPSFSADGRFLVFTTDGPRAAIHGEYRQDVLLHDFANGKTTVVSPTGHREVTPSSEPSVSAGGRFVAYAFGGDVVVRDRKLKRTTTIAAPGKPKTAPAISADGRYVAFTSHTRNNSKDVYFSEVDGDVFVHDRKTGKTTLVSVALDGRRGNDASGGAAISPNGRYVAFASLASDLVPHDTNDAADVFVRDLRTNRTRRVSISSGRRQANHASNIDYIGFEEAELRPPSISGHGPWVAFYSGASNLVDGDTNETVDAFVRGPLGP